LRASGSYPHRKTNEFVEQQAKAPGITRDEIERRLAGANLA
jgi:hypothetical protein